MSSDKNSSDSATQKVNITNEVLDEAAIKQAIEANQPRKSGILKRIFFDFGRKSHWSSARKGFLPHLSILDQCCLQHAPNAVNRF